MGRAGSVAFRISPRRRGRSYVFVDPDLDRDVTRRLARVVVDGTGQACRPPEFQGDPIAAGTIREPEVMGGDARGGHSTP